MNKTSATPTTDALAVDIKGLMNMCGVGRGTAEKIGGEAGAVIRIGRRKLYNVEKVRKYLIEITGA